jgi:hypothetical protein
LLERRRRPGDTGPLLFDELEGRDAMREAVPIRFSLESLPNDTVDQIRDKERALAAMNARGSALRRWRRVADLWCASSFAGEEIPAEAFGALMDAILTEGGPLAPHAAAGYLRAVDEISRTRRFFHWELEYPEVFFAADGSRLQNGGFDAVLGNPPWDMLRADNRGSNVGRDEPARLLRFARDAGIYTAQSEGHVNSYQLFTERAIALARTGGRVGLVLPAGIAIDRGSAALRRLLLSHCDVDALVGLDNSRRIFPIHRSVRFLLVTAAVGRSTRGIACRFGISDPAELESIGEDSSQASFPVHLRPALLARLSGPDLTIPWLRQPLDLAIAERATALFPPLDDAAGWSARFGRELNVTEDRQAFQDGVGGLPVVEGKQVRPFSIDLSASRWTIGTRDAMARLRDRRYTRPRLAYRDVASSTNQLTMIAAILPAGCVSTHTLFCLRTPLAPADQHLLCGLLNSFVVNFLVRLRVSTHVTTAIVERLPIPTREAAPAAAREIAGLARLLARRRDPAAYVRLQARVGELYQLSREEFAYVISTFPLVSEDTRRAALDSFAAEPAT